MSYMRGGLDASYISTLVFTGRREHEACRNDGYKYFGTAQGWKEVTPPIMTNRDLSPVSSGEAASAQPSPDALHELELLALIRYHHINSSLGITLIRVLTGPKRVATHTLSTLCLHRHCSSTDFTGGAMRKSGDGFTEDLLEYPSFSAAALLSGTHLILTLTLNPNPGQRFAEYGERVGP